MKMLQENLVISPKKCEIAQKRIEWLGFALEGETIQPLASKSAAIQSLALPQTVKQLRSYLEAIQHLAKFLPNLSHVTDQ